MWSCGGCSKAKIIVNTRIAWNLSFAVFSRNPDILTVSILATLLNEFHFQIHRRRYSLHMERRARNSDVL